MSPRWISSHLKWNCEKEYRSISLAKAQVICYITAKRFFGRAVDEELERKAKLGYKAVIADKNGKTKIVSAKYLVRKRRSELKSENCAG